MQRWHVCREDALKRSEEMLESDAIKFDQFLRDNEAQVNAAIRNADLEAKKRQDRQVGPLYYDAHNHSICTNSD